MSDPEVAYPAPAREGQSILATRAIEFYRYYNADSSSTVAGGTERIADFITGIPDGAPFEAAGLHIMYDTNVNTATGANNAQYLGRSICRVHVWSRAQTSQVPESGPGSVHSVGALIGTFKGAVVFGQDETGAPVVVINVPLGFLTRAGANGGFRIKFTENPFWGAFKSAQVMGRQVT